MNNKQELLIDYLKEKSDQLLQKSYLHTLISLFGQ